MNLVPNAFITDLTKELDRLFGEKATGELILTSDRLTITLYFLAGRLQYPVDKTARMRRWKRSLFQHCREWTPPTQILNSQPWEYDFLYQGMSKSGLTLEQAKSVIKTVAEECFYELALAKGVKSEWYGHDRLKSTFSYFLSLSVVEIHPLLTEIGEWRQEWRRDNIAPIAPSSAPILTEKGKAIPNGALHRYLNGQFTLWDISLQLKQPLFKLVHSLVPWQEKGLLEFKIIPDLPCPVKEIEEKPIATSAKPPTTSDSDSKGEQGFLIACIDDSPIVIHNLKSILTPAGFKVLGIPEPMAGFAQLIERKPDLILLDLNMPNANGYSICKFLRETPVFGKTPIIILTAQDSPLDRTRAKLVGANDFISKPPDPKDLIKLIITHLPQAANALNRLARV